MLYLAGELPDGDTAAVRTRLERDADARRLAESFRPIGRAAAKPTPTPRAGTKTPAAIAARRVAASLHGVDTPAAKARRRLWLPPKWTIYPVAAALMLAGLMGGWWYSVRDEYAKPSDNHYVDSTPPMLVLQGRPDQPLDDLGEEALMRQFNSMIADRTWERDNPDTRIADQTGKSGIPQASHPMNAPEIPRRPDRRVWTSRLALCACGLFATAALAQPTTAPSTRPADAAPGTSAAPTTEPAAPPRWGRRQPPPGSRLLRFRDIGGLAAELPDNVNVKPPDDDEWQRITDFAVENFPNRWKRFTEIQTNRPDAQALPRLKDRIVARYRTLKRIETEMPDLYAAALNQGKLEDDAWGASVAARQHPKDTKLQATMREKVAALVKDVLNERQKRVDALQQAVKAQQEDLDHDKQDVDNLIDLQMNRLTSDDPGDFWRRRRDGMP